MNPFLTGFTKIGAELYIKKAGDTYILAHVDWNTTITFITLNEINIQAMLDFIKANDNHP